MFYAVLRKPGAMNTAKESGRRKGKARVPQNTLPPGEWLDVDPDSETSWIRETGQGILSVLESVFDPGFLGDKSGIRWGTPLGMNKGKIFTPGNALALSRHLPGSLPRIDLTLAEAVAYLRKEVPAQITGKPGWYLMCYAGFPIGWAKQSGSGLKNYFPTHLRIRRTS